MIRENSFTPRQVCIVTPDVIGPINNGGIGTHVYHLALELATVHKVTIVFTGPIEHFSATHWSEFYKKKSIEFVHLNEMVDADVVAHTDWFTRRSYVVYRFLRERDFDFVHFQEWQANGLLCIMAKRSTEYFQKTTLTVTMHSSTEWIHEGMNKWVEWPLPDAKLEWCERYCCEFADILISPSDHMIAYCRERRWQLADDLRTLRYCFDQKRSEAPYEPLPGVFAFFGRLETRKGLEIFLGALEALDYAERQKIRKLIFLGKNGQLTARGTDGVAGIRETCGKLHISFEIRTELDAHAAIDHIRESRATAVIPSLVDNYPFTILETHMFGVPTIAASSGGIPEMLGDDRLFEPTAKALSSKLKEVLGGVLPQSQGKYDPKVAAQTWQALHQEPVKLGKRKAAEVAVREEMPLVSICVPYFNYGQFLEQTVLTLKRSTYKRFEAIIINDGSTDQASVDKFEALRQNPPDDRFMFISKENGGIGAARNFAASHAKGEFLIFCDADNCSTPEMIEEFLIGIYMTGGDVVSSHFKAFDQDVFWPGDDTRILYRYMPIGPALEVGMLANVFGDANSIMRKSAFDTVGGFQTERHTSWEDWDLLARLCLAGHQLDVCPKDLFWYRHTDAGFSRNTSEYQNNLRVLRAYADYGPVYMRPMLKNVLIPYHFGFDREHQKANRFMAQLNKYLMKPIAQPVGRKLFSAVRGLVASGSKRK
ncbi:glycosyltransferase (plasmid) [Ensifer sp. PDNC004]|uniref:glycosyltransferase n=1 Tax=Ensifer sp. PDNC004 TaxID=2811423 RepID=UPI00196348B8|nr:glycosyltransferase [Ensifer sp. PDNC004]QRY65483.1 glycosyltransferase [Ensifer sp. PDNC004]